MKLPNVVKRHFPQVARIALGIIFCFSGINYVYEIFPLHYSEQGTHFIERLKADGFVWPLLKITELLCGLMLVFGYFGPLALYILGPITVAIVLFHVVLSPGQGAILGYVAFALEVILLFIWWRFFRHMPRDFVRDVDKERVVFTKKEPHNDHAKTA